MFFSFESVLDFWSIEDTRSAKSESESFISSVIIFLASKSLIFEVKESACIPSKGSTALAVFDTSCLKYAEDRSMVSFTSLRVESMTGVVGVVLVRSGEVNNSVSLSALDGWLEVKSTIIWDLSLLVIILDINELGVECVECCSKVDLKLFFGDGGDWLWGSEESVEA